MEKERIKVFGDYKGTNEKMPKFHPVSAKHSLGERRPVNLKVIFRLFSNFFFWIFVTEQMLTNLFLGGAKSDHWKVQQTTRGDCAQKAWKISTRESREYTEGSNIQSQNSIQSPIQTVDTHSLQSDFYHSLFVVLFIFDWFY